MKRSSNVKGGKAFGHVSVITIFKFCPPFWLPSKHSRTRRLFPSEGKRGGLESKMAEGRAIGDLKDSVMAEKKEDFLRISGDSDFQGRSNSIFGCLDKLEPEQKADDSEIERKPHGARLPSRPRRVPDHILHPEKWTKYSLEEDGSDKIPGMSGDALNRHAALSFMDEIRNRKENAPKENSESDVEMTEKHVFSKSAIKHKMEVDETPPRSQIVEGVNVMAEYVVGRSRAKVPKTQLSSAENPLRSPEDSVELDHLQDQEASDDSTEKTENVSDSATEKQEGSFVKRKVKVRKGLRERKSTEDDE